MAVAEFPGVTRVPFRGGARHMTTSRNVGLLHVTGDVVAFLDDDANVRPGWLRALVEVYRDPTIAAVAGRTCNGVAGEDSLGVDCIGRLLPDGGLTGNFGARPESVVAVDHGIGANMSFRRGVLEALGGFRDDFTGVGGVREDTDVFLRLRALGYRAVFAPDAVADHIGAPHVEGRRFDFRYMFHARRNHALLLSRNFGIGSRMYRSWLRRETSNVLASSGGLVRRVVRVLLGFCGIVAGLEVSLRKAGLRAKPPERNDRVARKIRQHFAGLKDAPRASADC
jgi:GT2 family glycosyltransferase